MANVRVSAQALHSEEKNQGVAVAVTCSNTERAPKITAVVLLVSPSEHAKLHIGTDRKLEPSFYLHLRQKEPTAGQARGVDVQIYTNPRKRRAWLWTSPPLRRRPTDVLRPTNGFR